MKHTDGDKTDDPERAIRQVLQAERDAEKAVQDCEEEAHRIIQHAQSRAQQIQSSTDQRITNMEMRHSHKLDRLIKSLEREGDAELKQDIGHNYTDEELLAVIEEMAAELCRVDASSPKGG